MTAALEADLCIIGGGAGGLAVAAAASQMGARVVIAEARRMGGDCLNAGCVPSKALLAAGNAASQVRRGGMFGLAPQAPEVRFAEVHHHVHDVIAAIAPHDSIERFRALGCTVLPAHARFVTPDRVEAGDATIAARRFVLATGSRPAIPPIPGLAKLPHFTSESIFENAAAPGHLIVIGAGPAGCEMAQAHRRLGARVTLIDQGPMLPRDDPELTAVVKAALLADGVEILENTEIGGIERRATGIVATCEARGRVREIHGTHVLVAAGRRANVEDLGLERAGIRHSDRGVDVDERLRTSNRRVFAVGDVIGGPQFSHVAAHHAGVVIRNALLRLPARVGRRAVPRVTYTDPELAHVGLTARDAQAQGHDCRELRWPFSENDRAQAERRTAGQVKAIVTRRGRILGASIVGAQAGELLQPWILAIEQRLNVSALAGLIAPYPTLGEINKRVAGAFYAPTLFGPRMRRLVRLLARLG